MSPGYWRCRLFKNTFTYRGKRVQVNAWSVKIQHLGRRQTFSLNSSDRARAAEEACRIYQTILTQGWDSVRHRKLGQTDGAAALTKTSGIAVLPEMDAGYWRRRLIHRERSDGLESRPCREFSVRIEYKGICHYFLLGTANEQRAAVKACKIFSAVSNEGWPRANELFRRELTVAFHWASNPLAWTYTTVHTHRSGAPSQPAIASVRRKSDLHVAIIEPEAQIARAIAECVNHHRGFCCAAVYANAVVALQELPHRRMQLVLINNNLPEMTGVAGLKKLQAVAPQSTGVLYSVHEDSEQLFRSTPGGAAGYLLKRTTPYRILEPVAGTLGKGVQSPRQISIGVREHFQSVFASLPTRDAPGEMTKLTPRELEILNLLSKGYVDKEIAETLCISVWTVHGHVKSIFEKLDVHNRTEAVVKFLQK